MHNIILPTNRDNLASFPISIPLVSCSCLIAAAISSGLILKKRKSGNRGHSCLGSYFNGIALSVPHLGQYWCLSRVPVTGRKHHEPGNLQKQVFTVPEGHSPCQQSKSADCSCNS